MAKIIAASVSALTVLLAPVATGTTTWYVDGSVIRSGDGTSWPRAFKKIQYGINGASDGDTVLVAEGTYVENIEFQGKNIVLTSTDPLDLGVVAKTIIDGNKSGPVVAFSGTENSTCVLSGFTITNGGNHGIEGGYWHGGEEGELIATQAAIENNIIRENEGLSGGGIWGSRGIIRNNRVISNSAQSGGGLESCSGIIHDNFIMANTATAGLDGGGGLARCSGIIRDNTIVSNTAPLGCGGGLFGCDGTIEDNAIIGNSTGSGDGGGLCSCDGTIQYNTIRGNSTLSHGGGLAYCHGTIQSNTIIGNSASFFGGGLACCYGTTQNNRIFENLAQEGGGLFDCGPFVRGNLIAANYAASNGGGLACCDGMVESNTIASNSADLFGGGLYSCNGTVQNCIITWNTARVAGSALSLSSEPSYSCIPGWTGGGEGNVSLDPMFVDPDGSDDDPTTLEDNNYRLLGLGTVLSPCIDAGKNEPWMTYALDLDGNRRIFCGRPPCTRGNVRVDMGAYEHGSYPFKVVNLGMLPGMILLEWISQEEETYGVFSCSSLSPRASWTHVATVRSGGETTSWTDRDATSPQKFYRIEISY